MARSLVRALARQALKSLAYWSGALPAWHRIRNRRSLTVVMFHRVLDPADARWSDADPEYTVAVPLLAACLDFFKRHYNVIDLADLLAARRGTRRLPDRPLLITFDDGWADNVDYAVPLLRAASVPAVVFIAADPVLSPDPRWWQEELFRSRRLAAPQEPSAQSVFPLLEQLSRADETARWAAVAPTILPRASTRRDMMTVEQVRGLASGGVAVGSHGASHVPLAGHAAVRQDLEQSRRSLEAMLGPAQPEGVIALSFPHGRYDGAAVAAARSVGYALQFTSDAVLNDVVAGAPGSELLGRIPIGTAEIADPDHSLCPERLATWLFTRPSRRLSG